MKQKKLAICLIILCLFTICHLIFVSSVFAMDDTDRTRIVLERDVNKDNMAYSYIHVAGHQSISSFQVSLKVNTDRPEDINTIKMNWNSNIAKNAILFRADYNKDTATFNIYVVSKTELTIVNEDGNIILPIGNITIDTKNTEDLTVVLTPVPDSIRSSSINHIGNAIGIDEGLDKVTFDVSPKVEKPVDPTPNPGPDDNEKPVDPTPNPGPDDNEKPVDPTPNPSPDDNEKPVDPTPNPGPDDNEKPVDPTPNPGPDDNEITDNTINNEITNTTKPNGNNNQENIAPGKLPQTGITGFFNDHTLFVSVSIMLVCLIVFIIYRITKNEK